MAGLGWTWEGPRQVTEDGVTHFELTVRELPDFFVAGHTRDEVLTEARPALAAFLQSYVENGESPPLPADDHWRITVVSMTASGLLPATA
jgi:predicted RNase H-like HicB family nuclease